jgi:hypothetical protein
MAAQPPGGPLEAPTRELLTRARVQQRRRRQMLVAATAVVTALAISVPVLLTGRAGQSGAPTTQPSPVGTATSYPGSGPGSAAALKQGHWSRLPAAPISGRTGQATVWTGQQMLIWGGGSGKQGADLNSDGAAYDPAANSWSMLPAGPLSARSGMAEVWTGHDMFVWGGYDHNTPGSFHAAADGALYSPATHLWRQLPPSPLSPRVQATALWTGSEVIVIGGEPAVTTAQHTTYTDAAAYNPTTNTWRRLPTPPTTHHFPVASVSAMAAGRSIYAWLTWVHITHQSDAGGGGRSGSAHAGVDLDRYDTSTGRWIQVHAKGDLPTGVNSPVWTGSEILMPSAQLCPPSFLCPVAFGTRGWRFNPGRNTWTAIAAGPGDALHSQAAWTGRALLVFNNDSSASGDHPTPVDPGDIEVWAPNTNQWTALPRAPYSGDPTTTSAVWTGDRLLMWGEMTPDGAATQPLLNTTPAIGLSYGG